MKTTAVTDSRHSQLEWANGEREKEEENGRRYSGQQGAAGALKLGGRKHPEDWNTALDQSYRLGYKLLKVVRVKCLRKKPECVSYLGQWRACFLK